MIWTQWAHFITATKLYECFERLPLFWTNTASSHMINTDIGHMRELLIGLAPWCPGIDETGCQQQIDKPANQKDHLNIAS